MVLVSIAHPLAQVLNAHSFVTGHDFTAEAVNHALTQSTCWKPASTWGCWGGWRWRRGWSSVTLGATRTGLMARWTMYLGIFAALLAFTPFGLALGEVQQLIPAFWMVATGILLMGRWPGGDPEAWAAGEARPWPSSAEARAQRDAGGAGGRRGRRSRAAASTQPSIEGGANGTGGDVAPEPMQPARGGSSKRRRKRGARG